MKKASVREVRHDFGRVLKWVEGGEEVTILKRNRPVARLCPPRPAPGDGDFEIPDFAGRAEAVFGKRRTHVSDLVLEEREAERW